VFTPALSPDEPVAASFLTVIFIKHSERKCPPAKTKSAAEAARQGVFFTHRFAGCQRPQSPPTPQLSHFQKARLDRHCMIWPLRDGLALPVAAAAR
jgi:hypothetical protein